MLYAILIAFINHSKRTDHSLFYNDVYPTDNIVMINTLIICF